MTPTFIIQNFTFEKEANVLTSDIRKLGLRLEEIPQVFYILGATGVQVYFGKREMLKNSLTYDPFYLYHVANKNDDEYFKNKYGLNLNVVITT